MKRALIGAAGGAVCGLLCLVVAGAWGGYTHNTEWYAAPAPPPARAAANSALWFVAYFWWFAVPVGAVTGGLAGLGSWVVRPRSAGSVSDRS